MTSPARFEVPRWVAELRAVTLDFGNTLVPVGHEDLRRVVALTVETILGDRAAAEREDFLAAWAEERERQFTEDVPQFREVDIAQRFVRVFARRRGMMPPRRDERWDDDAASAYSDEREVTLAVDAYVEAFVASLPMPPDVEPLLAELSSRYRIAILSNWPVARAIDRYVEVAGWAPFLDAIVVSQRVGAIKPRPEIFHAAEAAFEEAAEARRSPAPEMREASDIREASDMRGASDVRTAGRGGAGEGAFSGGCVLHVGDDWAADIVGAKQAGWRAAYLRVRPDSPLPASERDERVRADLEIDRLAELREVLLGSDGGR